MRRTHLLAVSTAVGLTLSGLATAGVSQAASLDPGGHHLAHPGRVAASTTGAAQRNAELRTADAGRARTARALHLGSREALVVKDVVRESNGAQHVRFERTYAGLPVIGGDLVVHEDASGEVASTTWAHRGALRVTTTTPAIPASSARGVHVRKVVYAGGSGAVLAFESHVTGRAADGTPIDKLVYTDAHTGKVLGVNSNVMTDDPAVGTGQTLDSGTVPLGIVHQYATDDYALRDLTRGDQQTYTLDGAESGSGTLVTSPSTTFGTLNDSTDPTTVAADAHYGAAETWDFYQNTFGRNGIDNDGVAANSYVHFGNGYDNAFWDNGCFCMTYGDGSAFKPLVSLDVAGHEMSHGVTAATDGLNYSREAGGLNESSSDVMGTMVEFYAANPIDPGDYLIGEKVVKTGTALRRMDNPASDGRSRNCWSSTVASLDPHYSSGVGNHLFYLLAEGSGTKVINGRTHRSTTCDGSTLSGIGRDTAAQIWYRAMTTYWVSTETYHQAANGMTRAAVDLYGQGSPQCKATRAAWRAVKAPATTTCYAARLGGTTANVVRDPGFETGGTTVWHATPTHRVYCNDEFTQDIAHRGSCFAWMGGYRSTKDLIKESFRVPAGGASTLRFYLLNDTSEYRSAAAHDFFKAQIGYAGVWHTVSSASNRSADSVWDLKTVDISTFRGKYVTLRFWTSNNSYRPTNFLLDDVSVVSTLPSS